MVKQLAMLLVCCIGQLSAIIPPGSHGIRLSLRETGAGPHLANHSFADYKKVFERTYAHGDEEHAMRERLFDDRVARMQALNAQRLSWKEGVNQFTDRTEDELRQYRGYRRNPKRTPLGTEASSVLESSLSASPADIVTTALRHSKIWWAVVEALSVVAVALCAYGLWMSHGEGKSRSSMSAGRFYIFLALVTVLVIAGLVLMRWRHEAHAYPPPPVSHETRPCVTQTCSNGVLCCSGLTCNANGLCEESKLLPDSIDWSAKLPSGMNVPNQGACGSCWAVAAASSIQLQGELLTKTTVDVSAQGMLGCSPNPDECGGSGGCQGSIPELGFAWVAKNGVQSTKTQAYTASDDCPSSALRTRAEMSIIGHVKLEENKGSQVMNALAVAGPVVAAVEGGSWHGYSRGVFDGCDDWDHVVDHAVTLVGWGAEQGVMYWKIRNSWGKTWGEEGFIRLRRHTTTSGSAGGEAEPCAWDTDPGKGVACKDPKTKEYPARLWVCGECGILSDVTYPVGTHLSQD